MVERVRRIAANLGYVANEQARSLASGASCTVGLFFHDINDPYFSEISSGVLDERFGCRCYTSPSRDASVFRAAPKRGP